VVKPRITAMTCDEFKSPKNGHDTEDKQIQDARSARINGGDTRTNFSPKIDAKKCRFHVEMEVSALGSAVDSRTRCCFRHVVSTHYILESNGRCDGSIVPNPKTPWSNGYLKMCAEFQT
jgi:hypothetical protein